jgi:hypothetical protein
MISSVRRTCALLIGIFLLCAAIACGDEHATPAHSAVTPTAPCPGPLPLSTPQVLAEISPNPMVDPATPTEASYALQVPPATELLVVVVEARTSSKNDLVPSFKGPDGQIVTRTQLLRDDITGGNPGDLGFTELMHIPSPKTGAWILRLHNSTGGSIATTVKATALFHLHRPPLGSVIAQPASGSAPLTVTFDATATKLDGGTATYCWDFDDGATAWGVKASHTFSKPGVYFVGLTVTDDQGRQGFAGAQVTVTN